MPPSQLKRLKSTLRKHGIVGPPQTKKQRKRSVQNGMSKQIKLTREVALAEIREQLNPFEFKASTTKKKFESISPSTVKASVKRPSLLKSRDEEIRRNVYFEEQKRKRKVGSIVDRRFGENDPKLAVEEKMLQRFVREKQLRYKNNSMFDLEDAESAEELTHMGRTLSFDNQAIVDDFEEKNMILSDSEENYRDQASISQSYIDCENIDENLEEDNCQPQQKKSKQEVMKEVIAKSKLHKYERQAAKDQDEDLREKLDKEMLDIQNALRMIPPRSKPGSESSSSLDSDIRALQTDIGKANLDRNYDIQLRQMVLDKRSIPTEKSKTEDERAAERVKKLQELESQRLRRMQGKFENSDDDTEQKRGNFEVDEEHEDFGFGDGIKVRPSNTDLGVEDEDDFLIEDDIVASGSDLDIGEVDSANLDEDESSLNGSDDDLLTYAFTEKRLVPPEQSIDANFNSTQELISNEDTREGLAYRYPCPQSHEELIKSVEDVKLPHLPTVVKRIRVLYNPKLHSENNVKLGNFSAALVDHVSYLANQEEKPSFKILDALIRHIHSLSKSFPVEIANAFRRHLESLTLSHALSPTAGDLILLTAIGSIFPTSDHFHQVVTPAMLSMTRYLGLKIPEYLNEYAIGSYICTLCIHYQRVSKRYIPEVMNFIHSTLCVLAPVQMSKPPIEFPYHKPKLSLRYNGSKEPPEKLDFYDLISNTIISDGNKQEAMKSFLIDVNLKLLDAVADLWADKEAFIEAFQPSVKIVQHLGSNECSSYFKKSTQIIIEQLFHKLSLLLSQSKISRRPLELHHHRPLAIKTYIPKFEESFNPERHYDPDKTRTDIAKLKKEHKREKKGTIRELRKHARTQAIQSLKEKKERDTAYEKKFKRLVAEIQAEEGKETKAYEREKEWRKKSRK